METQDPRREEFVRLVREHSRSMFRAARALLDSDAAAEDAVGEAVLLAWQSFPRLRDPSAAKSWLLRICVNCACGQRRKTGREVALEGLEERVAPERDEERSYLWDAVRALPEDQRLAVLLYYYEDMPVAEIARTLGIAQGTVKSRLSRGRDRLRQMLREEEQYGNQRT